MLTSCSDDALESNTNEENTENSGSNYTTNTYTGGGAYRSPWNVNTLQRVAYAFDSNGANWDGIYVRITPYIGVGYFDGNNDGMYFGLNLTNGNYPNLFVNGQEYGNYVQANPIVLAGLELPWATTGTTHETNIFAERDHCPLVNIAIEYNGNLYGMGFDIVNNAVIQPAAVMGNVLTPPPSAGTIHEEQLLRKYGKVMYYKVEYGADRYNFNDAYYVTSLDVDMSLNPTEWSSVNLTDVPFNHKLYYHSGDVNTPATKEIVADLNSASYPNFQPLNQWFSTNNNGLRKVLSVPSFDIQNPTAEPTGVTMFFK